MAPVDDKTTKRDVRDLLNLSSGVRANFVVLAGEDIGRKYEITKTEMIVGRSETADIFIDDQDVSRAHAKIEVQKDSITISDLGSTNGTLVNGKPVQRHDLKDGDKIQIGNITILKFNFLDNIEETFNEQLYNAANKDFLTGIYNKKYFMDRLRMEFSYSHRHASPLSLMVIDLDHFKRVNDKFGHSAGDYVLRELSGQFNSIKRHEDLFARWGGEEFVLLLRDTPKDTAIQIAEKLRSRIEEYEFITEDGRIPVTISIGLATLEEGNYKTHDTFFRAADGQLLKAKKSGRNRVSFGMEGVSDTIKAQLG
jgi:two-component system, cell cycle response regulator